ncbi:uncharacterized protein VP01_1923g11 [Puccinia sorghi]|uniref:Uncharacterized protein n=1 Tax=Puccinia sorghi TaxID=27349 RepID=A0A0L6VCP0_9BASI|nr:uncharacterized protein VP01_1923g11 [Puccinia sorghi]
MALVANRDTPGLTVKQLLCDEDAREKTDLSLMEKFSPETLQRPYTLIEEKLGKISRYVNKWLQFQSLWNLKADYLYGRLVQAKVNAKYGMWQKDILVCFGSKLGSVMRAMHGAITESQHDLEHDSIETSLTAQAVSFITFVQDLKRKMHVTALDPGLSPTDNSESKLLDVKPIKTLNELSHNSNPTGLGRQSPCTAIIRAKLPLIGIIGNPK